MWLEYWAFNPEKRDRAPLALGTYRLKMEHFADRIHGWFDESDMLFYQSIVAAAPSLAHFVEVGSWKGRSSAYMAVEIHNSGKKIQFDCVDTWLGSEEHQQGGVFADSSVVDGTLFEEFCRNMQPVEGLYHSVRLLSIEAAKRYKANSLDFVFLDAAHDYMNVRADIKAWLPKIKPGGILAGHDSHHPPIMQACKECLPSFQIQNNCWWYRK